MTLIFYFDPGLGAMLVQALVATIAGIAVFSKNLKTNIKNFFLGKSDHDVSNESINIDEDEERSKPSKE